MNFKMSWTLDGDGGNKRISSWSDILNQLKQLQGREGSVTLDMLISVETGAEMLQVRAESGYYLMTLGEMFEGEYQVRTYMAPSKSGAEILILGDHWPEWQLTQDFDLVVRAFNEFFDSGNVSTALLN